MAKTNRRDFLRESILATSAAATARLSVNVFPPVEGKSHIPSSKEPTEDIGTPIDFRYAPRVRHTTFCFPDDHNKSLTDETGTLLYGYDSKHGTDRFLTKVSFGLDGMQPADRIGGVR